MHIVDPDALRQLAGQLDGAAAALADIAGRVASTVVVDASSGWRGEAADAYAAAIAVQRGRLEDAVAVLHGCAKDVRQLAVQLADELATLRSIEHRVFGLLDRLGHEVASAADNAASEASRTLHWVRRLVLPPGAPGWRDVERRLTTAGLL